jgi:hypothetical protein
MRSRRNRSLQRRRAATAKTGAPSDVGAPSASSAPPRRRGLVRCKQLSPSAYALRPYGCSASAHPAWVPARPPPQVRGVCARQEAPRHGGGQAAAAARGARTPPPRSALPSCDAHASQPAPQPPTELRGELFPELHSRMPMDGHGRRRRRGPAATGPPPTLSSHPPPPPPQAGARGAGAGALSGGEGSGDDGEGGDGGPGAAAARRGGESLLVSAARARAAAPEQTVEEKVAAEEQDIMRNLTQKQALKAVQELAAGVTYTKSMATGWKAPLAARRMSQRKQQVAGGGHVLGGGLEGAAAGRRAGRQRPSGGAPRQGARPRLRSRYPRAPPRPAPPAGLHPDELLSSHPPHPPTPPHPPRPSASRSTSRWTAPTSRRPSPASAT